MSRRWAKDTERAFQAALRTKAFTVVTGADEVESLLCHKCLGQMADIWENGLWNKIDSIKPIAAGESWGDGWCSMCGNEKHEATS